MLNGKRRIAKLSTLALNHGKSGYLDSAFQCCIVTLLLFFSFVLLFVSSMSDSMWFGIQHLRGHSWNSCLPIPSNNTIHPYGACLTACLLTGTRLRQAGDPSGRSLHNKEAASWDHSDTCDTSEHACIVYLMYIYSNHGGLEPQIQIAAHHVLYLYWTPSAERQKKWLNVTECEICIIFHSLDGKIVAFISAHYWGALEFVL